MNHELNKEIAFDKVNQWLNDYGFTVNVTTRNKDKGAITQFESKVYPRREKQRFFFVTFGDVVNRQDFYLLVASQMQVYL